MQFFKYRVLNKYKIAFFVLTLLGMFVYWMFESRFFSLTIGLYFHPYGNVSVGSESQSRLLSQILKLDSFMDLDGFSGAVMPVLLFSNVILFYKEKRGLFSFRYVRGESQRKVILSTIAVHALINAVLVYLTYIIYLTVGYLFIGNQMNLSRNTFDALFGSNFNEHSQYLFYIVAGIPAYFIGSFVYSCMACTLALFCRKAYVCIIYMLSYYWGINIILQAFTRLFKNTALGFFILKLEPTYLYGFLGMRDQHPTIGSMLSIMLSLVIPIVITIVLILKALSQKERLYE